jgi:protein-tyrosine phosphatase
MGRHRRPEVDEPEFRLLFVCTGNICRSPFAEILTRHLLIGRLGGHAAAQFRVSSAGVQAVVGGGMHADSRTQLAPWGLERAVAGRFVARQVTPAMVDEAHLVLGASPRHRSAVVQLAPAALTTAFSIREFARLARLTDARPLPTEPVARAHALVEETRLMRGLTPPGEPGEDRIPDPMGQPVHAHARAALLISDAVRTIVDAIAPPVRSARIS